MLLFSCAFEHPGDKVSVPVYLAATDRTYPGIPTVRRPAMGAAENMSCVLGDLAVLHAVPVNNAFDSLAGFERRSADRTGLRLGRGICLFLSMIPPGMPTGSASIPMSCRRMPGTVHRHRGVIANSQFGATDRGEENRNDDYCADSEKNISEHERFLL